ncbi:unnamed protein product, partial [Brassica rapa subsp. narinosa]
IDETKRDFGQLKTKLNPKTSRRFDSMNSFSHITSSMASLPPYVPETVKTPSAQSAGKVSLYFGSCKITHEKKTPK